MDKRKSSALTVAWGTTPDGSKARAKKDLSLPGRRTPSKPVWRNAEGVPVLVQAVAKQGQWQRRLPGNDHLSQA